MLRTFILLCILVFSLPLTAAAQDATEIKSRFIKRNTYNVTLARAPDLLPGQFIMRFVQPVSMTGCIEVIPMTYAIKKAGQRMEIKIEDPKIIEKELVFETHCNEYVQEISGDVILNRDVFIDDGIQYLTLKSARGQNQYQVAVTEQYIRLIPKSEGVFKPYETRQNRAPLTHWFYPEGVVILSAPAAQEDVTGQIRSLAMQKGFVEIETALSGFRAPMKTPNTLYMIDQSLQLSQNIKPGIQKPLGHVTVSETLIGPDGPYEGTKKIDVLARLPQGTE